MGIESNDIKFIKEFDYNDVVILEKLGKGGFGKVMKAYHKRKCEFVAIKYINGNFGKSSLAKEFIFMEHYLLKTIQGLKTPSHTKTSAFLNYYGIFREPSESSFPTYLLLMQNGVCNLSHLLKSHRKYSISEVIYILKTLVSGFALLQSNGICHRDIKPSNILLTVENETPVYKIADFGNSCLLPQDVSETSMKTLKAYTELYAAPEVKNKRNSHKSYNPFKADVYSLGVTFIEILGKYWKETGNGLPIILESMIAKNPKKRPDFVELEEVIEGTFGEAEITRPCLETEIQKYERTLSKKNKEKKIRNLSSAVKFYRRNYVLYLSYRDNVTQNKLAKKCLDECKKTLKKIKTKYKGEKEFYLDEEEILILIEFSNYYREVGDLENASKYLKKCKKLLDNYENGQENES